MNQKALLVTSTKEPYQPVRLTYSIRSRFNARKGLRRLRCVGEDARDGTLTIWLTDEARELFGAPEPQFERFGQSVILGTFRFPSAKTMALQVRSHERAKGIAKLVRGALGNSARLVRGRIVNRLFAAEEQTGEIDELDRCLDRDVVKVDPKLDHDEDAELEEMRRAVEGRADKLQAAEEFLAARRHTRPRKDVPIVEDFPLWPEEESEDLRDLRMTLDLRFARAVRRWNGEDVTLHEVIEQMVDRAYADGRLH